MKIKGLFRISAMIAVLGCNISCDQISKSIVRQSVGKYEQISLLNDHLTLLKVENSGAFLSLGNSWPEPLKILVLTIFPLIVLGLALIFLLTNKKLSNLTITGSCFIVGGGVGNIYDRLIYGSVTDFLHIDFAIFQTGVFNMADVSIMTGFILVIYDTYFRRAEAQIGNTVKKDAA